MAREKTCPRLMLYMVFISGFCCPSLLNALRWPVDSPTTYPGNSSIQHVISGGFLDFRGIPNSASDPPHYHGGVDIAEPQNTSVYSVRVGRVDEVTDGIVGVVTTTYYDPNTGELQQFHSRYIHVKDISVFAEDSIIVDPNLDYCVYNPTTFRYDCPIHIAIANIDDYPPIGSTLGDHLHFEDVLWDHSNAGFPDNYYFKWNPMDDLSELQPFLDTSKAVFESPNKFTIYDQKTGDNVTKGTGTINDPYIVSTDFDLRVRGYDRIVFGGQTRKVNIFAFYYDIYDQFGYQVSYGDLFSQLEYAHAASLPTTTLKAGIGYVYDTLNSTGSSFYWYATNYYDNYSSWGGGTDSYVDVDFDLFPEEKYKVVVTAVDIQSNEAKDSMWIFYHTTGEAVAIQESAKSDIWSSSPRFEDIDSFLIHTQLYRRSWRFPYFEIIHF